MPIYCVYDPDKECNVIPRLRRVLMDVGNAYKMLPAYCEFCNIRLLEIKEAEQ